MTNEQAREELIQCRASDFAHDNPKLSKALDCAIRALGDGCEIERPSDDDLDELLDDNWEDPTNPSLDEDFAESLMEQRSAYLEGMYDLRNKLFPPLQSKKP